MKNSRLVYSTETGKIKTNKTSQSSPKGDGIVRIRREVSGRKGKGVSVITGLELAGNELQALAKALKQLCGTGGAVKNGAIEIQGDNREKLKAYLENKGYTVKLAGG